MSGAAGWAMWAGAACGTLAAMDPAVEIDALVKRFGPLTAVDRLTLRVGRGEALAIVGPNGAGKTTAVECAIGLRRPDGGRVRVLGLDPRRERRALHRRAGVALQVAALPDRLRVGEAISLFASYHERPADGEQLLADWDFAGRRDAAFGDLSGGERKRLFLCLALVNRPEIVFLDEFTEGLDPHARRVALARVADLRRGGTTIVLVTHALAEAEQLCDRVAVLAGGRLVALDAPAALRERTAAATLDEAYLALTAAEEPVAR